jgi:transcriptional regulator with XRE-family HTH domain
MTTFAKNVEVLFKEKGITQRQLAELIGRGEQDVSRLLNRQTNTTLDTVELIADVLKVSPGSLIDRPPRK